MRVLVVSDMEGVAGISNWQQVTGGESLYEEGRRLYTEEINAAVRGAFAGGATDVVVMDCHGAGKGWSFNSLVPDELDERCEFVVQREWTEYTGALEEGARSALANLAAVAPYDPGCPCEVRVELATPDHAAQFRHHPAVDVVDARTIVSRADDWWTAWRQFYFSYTWPD